jgi:hypothetical protein
MKNNDDIPTTDATEIKQLINRVLAAPRRRI